MIATTTCPGTQHMAQLPPPLPTTESPHQHPPLATATMPARPTLCRASANSLPDHAHATQPQHNSWPTVQTTWHHPGTLPPNSMVQPPAAPHPCCPPPAPPTCCQQITGNGGVQVGIGSQAGGRACTRAAAAASATSRPPPLQGAGLHSFTILNYIINIIYIFPPSLIRPVQSPNRLCLFF
jgi:hypothetical protein